MGCDLDGVFLGVVVVAHTLERKVIFLNRLLENFRFVENQDGVLPCIGLVAGWMHVGLLGDRVGMYAVLV